MPRIPLVRPNYRFLSSPLVGGKRKGKLGVKKAPKVRMSAMNGWMKRLVQTQSLPLLPPTHEKVISLPAYPTIDQLRYVEYLVDADGLEGIDTDSEPEDLGGRETDESGPTSATPSLDFRIPRSPNGGDTEQSSNGSNCSMAGHASEPDSRDDASDTTSKASDWGSPTFPRRDDTNIAFEPQSDADTEIESDTSSSDAGSSVYTLSPSPVREPYPLDSEIPTDNFLRDLSRAAPPSGQERNDFYRAGLLTRFPSLVETEVESDVGSDSD
ncbi:hypothetical protein AURDEDRAFT_130630 [Auricularia subglabra TFB-10046 SS5]|uniref:Uncharacterized protein n=1 Tax=Auricularia subglabra (strain TFB-10046 / SS5) TaxID=717982 RepID=J0LEW2_AURST|nr:hypothetical protein AURDEDRAFT_130630 [Auricularia subglabra TFB-10046 SS5]